jgi:demethoxyubiquinone hydroxylase (CLK1/Coq7/Cat5 family)
MLSLKNSNLISKKSYILIARNSSSFNYKSLPEESKKIIDRIIRVDHAGKT